MKKNLFRISLVLSISIFTAFGSRAFAKDKKELPKEAFDIFQNAAALQNPEDREAIIKIRACTYFLSRIRIIMYDLMINLGQPFDDVKRATMFHYQAVLRTMLAGATAADALRVFSIAASSSNIPELMEAAVAFRAMI